ncbi:uncharacterized protein LOC114771721 [Denticeps clupeoides]|uniref:uncharacterized protein LOC114771721 n=1 Tax=Denticeps clupeoides TaxID=299321 RepID=UPI0010A53C89|nr:uncharacterized protein LOC114771721 [Denticeps clupeoides]
MGSAATDVARTSVPTKDVIEDGNEQWQIQSNDSGGPEQRENLAPTFGLQRSAGTQAPSAGPKAEDVDQPITFNSEPVSETLGPFVTAGSDLEEDTVQNGTSTTQFTISSNEPAPVLLQLATENSKIYVSEGGALNDAAHSDPAITGFTQIRRAKGNVVVGQPMVSSTGLSSANGNQKVTIHFKPVGVSDITSSTLFTPSNPIAG